MEVCLAYDSGGWEAQECGADICWGACGQNMAEVSHGENMSHGETEPKFLLPLIKLLVSPSRGSQPQDLT